MLSRGIYVITGVLGELFLSVTFVDGGLRILIAPVSNELYPDSAVAKHGTNAELHEKRNIENYLKKKEIQTEGLGPFSVVEV